MPRPEGGWTNDYPKSLEGEFKSLRPPNRRCNRIPAQQIAYPAIDPKRFSNGILPQQKNRVSSRLRRDPTSTLDAKASDSRGGETRSALLNCGPDEDLNDYILRAFLAAAMAAAAACASLGIA
jgi:hypothetical protein